MKHIRKLKHIRNEKKEFHKQKITRTAIEKYQRLEYRH